MSTSEIHSGPLLAPVERGTLARLFLHGVDSFGPAEALRHRHEGGWTGSTYREVGERVARLARGLTGLRVRAGDRVALLSENRPEWAIADYAVLALGAVVVPLYPTLPADQIAHILADSGARVAFVSSPEQHQKIRSVRDRLPDLETVVVMDTSGGEPGGLPFAELLEQGAGGDPRDAEALRSQALAVRPEDAATLIYTSGTTGTPKGVVLTHGNLAAMVSATRQHGSLPVAPGEVAVCLLPLSHIFERAVDYYYWDSGVTIAYAADPARAAETLAEVRPHAMVSVPRLFEKIYARVMSAAGAKGRLVRWAARVGDAWTEARLAGVQPPLALRLRHGLADRLVFSRLREAVGGRARVFISGGAPLAPEIARFFFAAGLPIHEGYGLTETSPVLAANRPGALRIGTVGVPYPGVELRIAENGEILARGPGVMRGYWNDPAATASVVDEDGWFHTGDIGAFDADGFLRITDRLKDLIVTAGGKNIAPQPIESLIAVSPYVAQAILIGDRRPYPVLLLVPDLEAVKGWAEEQGIGGGAGSGSLADEPRVRELLTGEALGRVEHLASYERPKRVAVVGTELTVESGLLTPSLKVRRRAVEERYRDLIEDVYRGG
jgi:long-chain acyl-CoA synthetase